jgi:acetyl-CoA acetyltransferase
VSVVGFFKKEEAPKLLREGYLDLNGKLPVNTDGGLMSRGHPLGDTALARGAGPNSGVVLLKRETGGLTS